MKQKPSTETYLTKNAARVYLSSVVHDAEVVVRYAQVLDDGPGELAEVVFQVIRDVLLMDCHVVVSVRSRLLVVEAKHVTQLVSYHPFLSSSK